MMKPLWVPLLLLLAQEPPEDRLRALVALLGADDLEVREQATRDLITLGPPAIPGLDKIIATLPEGEARVRAASIVQRIRRLEKIAEVAPPVRRATLTATDRPLKDVLADVALQTGVVVECAGGAGDKPVTIEIKGEPALQAVDRICLARGDVVSTLAEGKLKVAPGKPVGVPTAYVDGYRLRLRRRVVVEAGDFEKSRTDIVLHASFDAQPDQKVRSVAPMPGPAGGAVAFKSAAETTPSMMSTGGKTIATVDDVMIVLDDGDSLDLAFYLKDAPASLKSADTLRFKARYRYSVGFVAGSIPLTGIRRATTLGDLPYSIHASGRTFYVYAMQRAGQRTPPLLQDLIDLESLVVVDGAGKENKLSLQQQRNVRSLQFQFQAERDLRDEEMTLKYNLLDAVDREVEFELRDVRLRD